MPRSIDLVVESPASVEQVHSAFSDEVYWLARLAALGGGTTTLDSLIVDADGTVTVALTLDLRHKALPTLLAKVFPSDLIILCNETWRPIEGRQVSGQVSLSSPGTSGSGLAEALLAPIHAGSRLRFTGTVEVKVPLVGGTIESYIGKGLAEHIRDVQRFTTVWITGH